MKHLILLAVLAFTLCCGYSQQLQTDSSKNHISGQLPEQPNKTDKHDYDYYKNRSVGQKTGALFLMGGGIVLTVVGIVTFTEAASEDLLYTITLNDAPQATDNKEKTGAALAVVGIGMIAGSIPLFVASHKNKMRARLAPKSQQLSAYLPMTSHKQVHGLSLTIPLGKQ